MPDNRAKQPVTGLVLQGGGARGAYQVGVIKALAKISRRRKLPFPVLTGASVGAINVAPLATSASDFPRAAMQLEMLWRSLHCGLVYDTSAATIGISSLRWLWTIAFGGLGAGHPTALLDNTPLRQLLEITFDQRGLQRSLQSGALKALAVSASSYGEGSSVTFFTAGREQKAWSRARRFGRRVDINHRHLVASSALPFVFPAMDIGGVWYGDGALRLSAPLSPAIQLGAERLMIIGVRDNEVDSPDGLAPGERNTDTDPYPSIGDMSGHALDILFNDDLDADVERLQRVNKTVAILNESQKMKVALREIDTVILQPSENLLPIANRHSHEMPKTIKLLFKSIGAWGSDGRLLSYLLFEPGYIAELIDLGYADTMARKGELSAWLNPKD